MTPKLRKLNLAAHVTVSLSWTGAVGAFLVLAIAGMTAAPSVDRGVYLGMNWINLALIVPLCLASLATGLIGALGTGWGLFRYRWVATKLGLTLLGTMLLLLHQRLIAAAARWAASAPAVVFSPGGFHALQLELVQKAGLAIGLLVGITALGVYKPWGLTFYGRRRQHPEGASQGL